MFFINDRFLCNALCRVSICVIGLCFSELDYFLAVMATKAWLVELVAKSSVLMVTRPACPFCTKAKDYLIKSGRILRSLNITPPYCPAVYRYHSFAVLINTTFK